ncbi:MAG: thymidylate kinase [Ruminococcaceae bacterium]|nr:thymidylate kinase [Oscillospiraceae bacterium]
MGYFISIDGVDGSGKGTQSELLYEYLKGKGKKVRLLSFPTYEDPASSAVKLYLSGKLGSDSKDTGAYAASTFFAVDRYISYRNDWEKDYLDPDCIIIANRYTTANAVHQISKLPREEWDGFLDWLWDYEFGKLGLPAPDKVVYLQMPPEVSLSLINSRAEQTNVSKDIHEKDDGFIKRSYEAAMYVSQKLGWTVIHCVENGVLRTREDILNEIIKELDL